MSVLTHCTCIKLLLRNEYKKREVYLKKIERHEMKVLKIKTKSKQATKVKQSKRKKRVRKKIMVEERKKKERKRGKDTSSSDPVRDEIKVDHFCLNIRFHQFICFWMPEGYQRQCLEHRRTTPVSLGDQRSGIKLLTTWIPSHPNLDGDIRI